MILDRLSQIEFAFNYWNISACLLKKWISYSETIILRNNQIKWSIISSFVLSLIRIVYIFKRAILARHHSDEFQLWLRLYLHIRTLQHTGNLTLPSWSQKVFPKGLLTVLRSIFRMQFPPTLKMKRLYSGKCSINEIH